MHLDPLAGKAGHLAVVIRRLRGWLVHWNRKAPVADFYENRNARLEYNGTLYDGWVTDVAQSGIPQVWDQSTGRLLTPDPTGIAGLRGRLVGLHDLAVGFMGLLEEWGAGLDELIVSVDEYLAREGGGA